MAELTPMKQQHLEIKSQYPDCLLFFRLGDFYELFDDDAVIAARELDLALTTRDRGKPKEEQTPMCGVPFHAAENYLARLIQKGYRVAICEQTEDPALAKGLVKRDVIRVLTPGTVTDASMLDESRSNYICALTIREGQGAVAFCDVSTGEHSVASFASEAERHITNELGRFQPREALCADETMLGGDCRELLDRIGCMLHCKPELFDQKKADSELPALFGAASSEELGLGGAPDAVCASFALMTYISETQKCELKNIRPPELFDGGRYMELDYTTRRGLELLENQRSGEKKGSLLWVLDRTSTSMGARLLRIWLERPLLSPLEIRRRQSGVEELFKDPIKRAELQRTLSGIGDMQRLSTRAVLGSANARDLVAIAVCASALPQLCTLLSDAKSTALRDIGALDTLSDVETDIRDMLCEEPPLSVREGGMLRRGYSEEVDRLRELRDNGARMVSELEARERERTGIKKLKVGYNKVFGYYIDVPNSASETPLPAEYVRKQTLVSNERYFTPELKELESSLLTAKDRICDLEYKYFTQLRERVAAEVSRIQATASKVAELDVTCSLADVAARNGYCRPEVDLSGEIIISEGRHPVVEKAQKDMMFVPNDVHLNLGENRLALVTGPNMAGKSTYMRQTALIVLMAQIGSFVPASSAIIGVADRVFTRIGASDDISSGQSTFMVEMTEVAQILRTATKNSLIILDEIGRGTSTYDGMAIARAVLEYCADTRKLGAKTMFATHYHELTELEGEVAGVKNYSITAKKHNGGLSFLRRIVRGPADDSYGIEVAKLAGVPDSVVSAARGILSELENAEYRGGGIRKRPERDQQISMEDIGGVRIAERLRATALETITPIEAMNLLYELKKEAGD